MPRGRAGLRGHHVIAVCPGFTDTGISAATVHVGVDAEAKVLPAVGRVSPRPSRRLARIDVDAF